MEEAEKGHALGVPRPWALSPSRQVVTGQGSGAWAGVGGGGVVQSLRKSILSFGQHPRERDRKTKRELLDSHSDGQTQ